MRLHYGNLKKKSPSESYLYNGHYTMETLQRNYFPYYIFFRKPNLWVNKHASENYENVT